VLAHVVLACSFGESTTMAAVFSQGFTINDNVQFGRVLDGSAVWKSFVLDGFNDLKVCGIVCVDPGFPFRLTPMSFALRVTNSP